MQCMNRLMIESDISTLHLIHAHAESGSLLKWLSNNASQIELIEVICFDDSMIELEFWSEDQIVDILKKSPILGEGAVFSISYLHLLTLVGGQATIRENILMSSQYNLSNCKTEDDVLAATNENIFIAELMDMHVFN